MVHDIIITLVFVILIFITCRMYGRHVVKKYEKSKESTDIKTPGDITKISCNGNTCDPKT